METVKRGFSFLGVVAIVAVLLSVALLRSETLAQQPGFNVSLSPLPILLSAEPGDQVTTGIRIRNLNEETETFRVELYKFRAGDNGAIIETPEPEDEFINWVSFSETVFEAPSNRWVTVDMSIDLPQDAAFGYYYAVMFSRADEPSPEVGQAAIEGGAAVFVLLEAVVPGAVREAEVMDFTVSRRVYEFLPATINTTVLNTGNVHVAPQGNIFIKKAGNVLATLPMNESTGNILPKSSRNFVTTWSDGFPRYEPRSIDGAVVADKSGNVRQRLVWDMGEINKLRFGKHTAELVMIYNDGDRDIPVSAIAEFWVIPWRILAAVVLAAGFIIFNFYLLFNKFSNRRSPFKKGYRQRLR